MHDNSSSNVFRDALDKIQVFWKTDKKGLIRQTIVAFFVSFAVIFAIIWWLQDPFLSGKTIYISKVSHMYFSFGYVFHLILWFMLSFGLLNLRRATKKDYRLDKERNINIADNSPNKLLTSSDDLENEFDIGTIDEVKNNILGCIDGEYIGNTPREKKAGEQLVTFSISEKDDNLNQLYIGMSGAGKTTKEAYTHMAQIFERRESLICTDVKGDLATMGYNLAKKVFGYRNVKVMDLRVSSIICCDAIDFFGAIGRYSKIKEIKQEAERKQSIMNASNMCDAMADSILNNLSDDVETKGKDFWKKEGMNYIRFWVKYIFFNEAIPESEKNFKKLRYLLYHYRPKHGKDGDSPEAPYIGYIDDLANEIVSNPILNETCFTNYVTFIGGKEDVRDSVHAGLQVDFSAFTDLACEVTSHDEVDLSLPAKEPCAYFLIMDALTAKNKFLSATLFSLMYQSMIDYVASKEIHEADVIVNFILDEFLNIGVIPNFVNIIQVVRSYLFRHEIYVQTLSDFEKTYGKYDKVSIMSNCDYWIFLASNEKEVLTEFSEKSGILNEVKLSERKTVNRLNLLKDLKTELAETKEESERAVLLESEASHLKKYEMLVYKRGADMALLHTWYYRNHPAYKTLDRYNPAWHIPEWRMNMMLQGKEKELKEKAFWNSDTGKEVAVS